MPLLKIATEQSLAFILSVVAVWIIKPTIGAGTLLLVAIVFALSNIVLQSAQVAAAQARRSAGGPRRVAGPDPDSGIRLQTAGTGTRVSEREIGLACRLRRRRSIDPAAAPPFLGADGVDAPPLGRRQPRIGGVAAAVAERPASEARREAVAVLGVDEVALAYQRSAQLAASADPVSRTTPATTAPQSSFIESSPW